jgi:RimJ/RimL family protein N-acetyltransferase
VLKETGELIGAAGLVPMIAPWGRLPTYRKVTPAAERDMSWPELGLYWAIASRHQGRGYASEAAQALVDFAFQHLRLRRILATTDSENLASQGVMRKLGMRVEQNPDPEPPWMTIVGFLDNPALR